MQIQRLAVGVMLAAWVAMIAACGGVGKPGGAASPPGDMSLKEFILQKPSKPAAVQVDCRLDTYYNYAFSRCAETHYSFRVEGGSPSASAHAYAPKTSDYGKRLYEQLKSGSEQRMTLRLERVGPDGSALPAEHDSCFALVGIVDAKK